MEWESVKHIDPNLGLGQRIKPYTDIEKQLRLHKVVRKDDLPHIPREEFDFGPNVPVILVFGGAEPNVVRDTFAEGQNVYVFNPNKNVWTTYGTMPVRRYYHAAVFCRNNVYVTGGNNPSLDLCERYQATNTTFRLHVKTRKWTEMCQMKYHRALHSMIVVEDSIFVFGGRDHKGSLLSTAERYNPDTDKWSVLRQLREPRMGMGCTVYDGLIWLIGGVTGLGDLVGPCFSIMTTVTSYDPVKNQYFDRQDLPEPRAFCVATTLFKEVWIFGGLTKTDEGELVSVDWINWFNSRLDKWDRRHRLLTPCHSSSIAKVLHKVYIIGGMREETCVLREMEMYNRKEDRLISLPGMPSSVVGTAAVPVPFESFCFETTEKDQMQSHHLTR